MMSVASYTPLPQQQMDQAREDERGASPGELELPMDQTALLAPVGPPPTLPRKSSRRLSQRITSQDPEFQSSSQEHLRDSEQALDELIESFERSALETTGASRRSTQSSTASFPYDGKSSTGARSSVSSQSTWDDAPPGYDEVPQKLSLNEKRVSTVLSDKDKMLLKAEYPDEEADLTKNRSLSMYSQTGGRDESQYESDQAGGKTLYINAQGMRSVRLPLPSKELEIQIVNPDGTVEYISTRSKRFSADASLSKSGFGEYVRTFYSGKTTLTCRRAESITTPFAMTGTGLRRQRSFILPGSDVGELEWRYENATVDGKREERLVLVHKTLFSTLPEPVAEAGDPEKYPISPGSTEKKQKGKALEALPRVLARFSRSDLSLHGYGRNKRNASRAGIGGELVLAPGCTDVVPEEVVVATALVMIKREQDRLRIVQAAVLVTVLL